MKEKCKRFGVLGLLALALLLTVSLPTQAATKKYKNKWVTINNSPRYYNSKGKQVKGLQKINGKYYYFNKYGGQRTGWWKIGNDYYYFRIANGKKGYMLTSQTVNGIQLDSKGRAVKTADALDKLDLLLKAKKIVMKITTKDMTKAQKLRKCFEYVKTEYQYLTRRTFRATVNWERAYARDMFDGGRGNCFSYACAFAYLADAVGYQNVYAVSSGGHGWAEINGKVYDPDWALVSNVDSYFAMSYDLSNVNGRPNYKANRWYVIKI
ncbi:MAG: transglutaminase domain-containing protein [Eubacteriales bacterium]|nr:transglutaminase domain-containing protein [Eubacteriales bacterium]